MDGLGNVRAGQQVLGSDGGVIGTVEGVEGDVIAVRGAAEHGSGHHHVPAEWIDRVDSHVHLNRTAALARETWTGHSHAGGAAGAATPMPHQTEGKKGSGWAWLVLGVLVIIALYVLVQGLQYADDPSTSVPDTEETR